MIKIIRSHYFWLGLVILVGLFVRLYKIDAPLADWHSWRQADTAAVTRNFIKEGFNPFLPKFDDMSAISETPIANALRFRFVEFPIYNMVVYPLYLLFGVNETYHRLVSVLFSLGSIALIFLIAKRYLGTFTAFISALVFALLPFNVFFSRTALPESTFVFFALGMVYCVDSWIWEGRRVWEILGFVATMIAFLIKPWAIFFLLPLIYSIFKKEKKLVFPIKYILFFMLALIPFILWRLWILQQPAGIPASSWLLNSDGIRFRPAFFWWIISERIGREILGVTGVFLLVLGLITRPKNGNYFLHFWFLSHLLFITIFATGNVRHDYYQVILVPVLAIFLAIGLVYLFKSSTTFVPRIWTMILGLFFFVLTFYFGWKQVAGLYQINNYPIVEAGRRADQILPKDAVVLAPYNGDTAFLYQINRPGFPFVPTSIKDLIADYGVHYYISTSYDDKTNWVLRYFNPVLKTPQYVIVDLTKLQKAFDKVDPEP